MALPGAGTVPTLIGDVPPPGWVPVPGRPGWYAPPEIVPIYEVRNGVPTPPPAPGLPAAAAAAVIAAPPGAAFLSLLGIPLPALIAAGLVAGTAVGFGTPQGRAFIQEKITEFISRDIAQVTERTRRIMAAKTAEEAAEATTKALQEQQLAIQEAAQVLSVEAQREAMIAGFDASEAAIQRAHEKVMADVALRQAAAVAGVPYTTLTNVNPAIPLTAAGLLAIAPAIAQQFAGKSHGQSIGCMGTTGAAIASNVMGALAPAAVAASYFISPDIQNAFKYVALQALNTLYKPLEDEAPITPEKAYSVGPTLLMQAVGLGAGAHLLSVTAEAVAPLKNMGLGYLSAFMADMAGFSRIAAAFQGTMINWGLSQPMRYWAQEKFRTVYPDARLLMEMSLKREISDDIFNKYIAYQGFSDDWIDVIHRYKWRDPRLFEVLWIADVTRPPLAPPPEAVEWLKRAGMEEWIGPDWWYAIKFAKSGYDPIDIPVLAKVTKRRTLATARTRRLFSTRQLYREGYIGQDFIRDQFIEMAEPEEAGEDWIKAEKLERLFNLYQDMKKLYLDQHVKGLLDDGDLKVALSSFIVDPEMLDIELQKAITRVTPKVARDEPPEVKALKRDIQSKYMQLYRQNYYNDYLDEDDYYHCLVTLGIDKDLARVTVLLDASKKIPKAELAADEEAERLKKAVQTKYVAAYTDLYKKDLIGKAEFYGYLITAALPVELAEATLAAVTAQKLPKEKA